MTKQQALKLFEEKKVRTVWDDEQEKWYFSIVDVVSILTESTDGRKYWNRTGECRFQKAGSACHRYSFPLATMLQSSAPWGDT